MKKILALVLALVMTLSLATISSGAAFTDADKVQYVDAVNTLNALGVLNGYADGSIVPQGDVTRGAAAKMVAMVATGSNAATLSYYKGTSAFADVPAGHVFADAVAFCVARGIVAGYGDGNYGLTDNVKGWAVAKMVLVAMGYDAKAFGMEGAGSALNTITLATQAHLFDGMGADFVATEPASREECAQIVYNALTQKMKEASSNTNTGVVSYDTVNKCLLDNYFAAAENTAALAQLNKGVVTANQATGAYYTVVDGVNYNLVTDLDLVGHKVAVVKSSPIAKTDAYGATYYDAYAVVDLSTVVEVAANITSSTVKAEDKFHAAFGTGAIDYTGTVLKFGNYKVDNTVPSANINYESHTANAGTYVLYNDGTSNKLVSYMISSSDIVVVNVAVTNAAKGYYKVGTASDDDAYKLVVATAASCYDNVVSAEAIDWLAMVPQNASSASAVYKVTACGTKFELAEVATVEGKVTKVNTTASTAQGVTDGEIYIDGVKYGYQDDDTAAAGVLYATSISDSVLPGFTATYKFYLDEDGEVFAYTAVTEEDTNAYELAYVIGSDDYVTGTSAFGNEYGYTIQYYTLDGAVKAETYYSWNGNKLVAANAQTGEVVYDANTSAVDADEVAGWKLIAKTADGAIVKDLTANYTADTVTIAAAGSASTMATKLGSYFITSKSAFLYGAATTFSAANVDAAAKTGAHLNTISAPALTALSIPVVYANSTENATGYELVAAWVPAAIEAADKEFAYVVSYNGAIGKTADGLRDLYSWTVVDKNGEYQDLELITSYAEGSSKLYDWYEVVTASATGYVSLGDEYANTTTSGTDDALDGASTSLYTVNGVTYWNDGSVEYVATGAKVLDMREGVYTGAVEAVESVADAAALAHGSVVISGVWSYDAATYTYTLVYMIVADQI